MLQCNRLIRATFIVLVQGLMAGVGLQGTKITKLGR